MPLFIKKLNTGQIRTIKGLLKYSLVGLFFVFGIFGVFFNVFAFPDAWNVGFEESEGYSIGALANQKGEWSDVVGFSITTTTDFIWENERGVKTDLPTETRTIIWTPAESINSATTTGIHFLNIPVKSRTGGDNSTLKTFFQSSNGGAFIQSPVGEEQYNMRWEGSRATCDTGEFLSWGTWTLGEQVLPINTWVVWHLKFDMDKNIIWISWTIDSVKTDYSENSNECVWVGSSLANFNFNQMYFWKYYSDFGFDTINNVAFCSPDHCDLCETFNECRNVGCYWHYDLYENYFYCADYPTGECGVGTHWIKCQACLTQETCEAVEDCYWFYGFCKFKFGACGGGLECPFCDTQETCEAENCYWFDNWCYQFEPPEVSSWINYYSEHGDYPTSSEFINQMASTTAIIFGNIGSFLSGFGEAFDISEALAYGESFGSAIPKARGYLAIFNDFFGELPVAQAFLFLITFLLAVGLFRLVRNLIALFKFW